jgi:hypothetical protein
MKTMRERFWGKVRITESCWFWTGYVNPGGYGMFKQNGKPSLAHRIAYEMAHGDIPDKFLIDHRCHERSCVNPSHLRLATKKQNGENLYGANADSTSGVRGVGWHKAAGKWVARVVHNGTSHYLGLFADLAEAEAAVIAKRNELFTHNDRDRAA